MLIHTRSVAHKVFDIWRSPGRFTKNPDIVALPSGRYLLVYSDVDAHWSLEDQILVILASDDGGETWFKHCEIDRADIRKELALAVFAPHPREFCVAPTGLEPVSPP